MTTGVRARGKQPACRPNWPNWQSAPAAVDHDGSPRAVGLSDWQRLIAGWPPDTTAALFPRSRDDTAEGVDDPGHGVGHRAVVGVDRLRPTFDRHA
jgi:hypothetical protein